MTPTPMPTPVPITSPETCLTIKINILTDNYPGETEWTISDKDGNKVASGGDYIQGMTEYTHDQCLDAES
eukprot:1205792-Ditylum_brightwellii.AAC.1